MRDRLSLQERGKYSFYANENRKATNNPDRRRDFRKPISTATINNYIRNMRVFFNWLVENTLTGNLILTVMLAFAEYERGMIVERTQAGKAVARQDPNFREGRPKKFTPEQIELALSLLTQGKTYRQITNMTGISKSTLIRAKQHNATVR